jgi:ADP-ribose pyrophosphatase YjhB (NUDIX family)
MGNGDKQKVKVRIAGVYTRGDEILLVRHEKEGKSYWLLPGGGLEFGESMETGLERELMEEAAVKTKTGKLLFTAESLPPDKHRHVLNIVFLGQVLQGEAKLNEVSERLKEVAWKKKSEVLSLTFFPDLKAALLMHWESGFTLPAESLGDLWRD